MNRDALIDAATFELLSKDWVTIWASIPEERRDEFLNAWESEFPYEDSKVPEGVRRSMRIYQGMMDDLQAWRAEEKRGTFDLKKSYATHDNRYFDFKRAFEIMELEGVCSLSSGEHDYVKMVEGKLYGYYSSGPELYPISLLQRSWWEQSTASNWYLVVPPKEVPKKKEPSKKEPRKEKRQWGPKTLKPLLKRK